MEQAEIDSYLSKHRAATAERLTTFMERKGALSLNQILKPEALIQLEQNINQILKGISEKYSSVKGHMPKPIQTVA